MSRITVDFSKTCGPVKPMHAVGQPPFVYRDYSCIRYLKEANIPYSRLHDVGGAYGGSRYVDIHNVFPDFSADETDPASYDFYYTDRLLAALAEYGCAPVFRLGETIENDVTRGCRPRYIHPPKDYGKWARICEHIVRHYNYGWADGFEYGIEYWEIWNEPENGFEPGLDEGKPKNCMWTGTYRQYYELYSVAARHLRSCFGNAIKIGGYGSCGFAGIFEDPEKYGTDPSMKLPYKERDTNWMRFFDEFLAYVKETGAPLDFFSWHSYLSVKHTVTIADFVDRKLKSEGFDCEQHCNEWNNAHTRERRGTGYANANAVAMMLGMHATSTDIMCYYDARIGTSVYGGMFNPYTFEPFCVYYGFKAFGKLYALGNAVPCEGLPENVYGLAATDGQTNAVLLANIGAEQTLETDLAGYTAYLVDETHSLAPVPLDPTAFTLPENGVLYLEKKA